MDLTQIKAKLGVSTLPLATATKADGTKTNWMRYWDNDNRVAVSVHKDTVKIIKDQPTVALGLQTEMKTSTASGKEYTSHRIVAYTNTPAPEEVL